jgi:SAM-dependent methyltransferase
MTTISTTAAAGRYMFDAAWQAEQRRLAALETIWDPYTFANLEALGVDRGWRCLEVGGGNGSVAAWLCARVGPAGKVVATDLDTRFLATRDEPNLELRTHDITCDLIEEGAYDLVHCRLLLSHLPAHEQALQRMTAALKPGGWLLVEEFDHVSFLPDPASDAPSQTAWNAWIEAFGRLSANRGLDLPYGRRLLGLLDAQGLRDVHAEGRTVFERGGVQGRDLLLLSVQSLRKHLIDTGAIDDATIERLVTSLSDPAFVWQSQVMVAARGRKASAC